ncbi:MAG: fibro-slime domain-containing protein [Lachnospiraceae bacterium]|nr:fibro-slime domain-containing protein [Lachnospiraceae bacterium]
MKGKKILLGVSFITTMVLGVVLISKISDMYKSSAAVVKNYNKVSSQTSLPKVEYNGEEMYVADATYYDYYSNSQVGTGATPGAITDAKEEGMNTFGLFNQRIMEAMKYNVKAECPAQYPLYQGRLWGDFPDNKVWKSTDNAVNESSNYWKAANHHQGLNACATQGLVDKQLAYDSSGESYITQSNPANEKKANLPYFDKKFLTSTKHTGSELSVGGVKDNVAFPFRTEEEGGITYYEFDSAIDTIRFNSSNQLDYLGANNATEQVKDVDTEPKPGMFPENTPADSNSGKLNFGYGWKIEVPFIMTKDGKIDGKDMVFEFRGDDDVWVFVDGILALDLGGAHPKLEGSINFATGKSQVGAAKNNTVAFASRTLTGLTADNFTDNSLGIVNLPTKYDNYTTDFSNELKQSLKDTDKVHTLTLFYMERGMYVSNMKMKFNLPEPSRIDVENELKFDNVGKTFTEETKNVAKKDIFLYDVVDKTTSRKAEIDMVDGDSVSFLNEFTANDKLLVQETKLKSETRVLTDLYSTSWLLKDTAKEMAKATGLVVNDPRTTDKTILFANSDNKGVPNLNVKYTNTPLVGKFTLVCTASDKYKELHTDYKEKEFKYVVTYKNVFGGGSEEKPYVGSYVIIDEDDKETEKKTEDGIITLKPGQRAVISKIPVLTELKAKAETDDSFIISKVKTTSDFTYDKNTTTATGKINRVANIVEFVVGDKAEQEVEEEDKLTNKEIEDITGEKLPEVPETEKLEDAEVKDGDEYDDAVATGDDTDLKTWIILTALSLALTVGASVSMKRTNNFR